MKDTHGCIQCTVWSEYVIPPWSEYVIAHYHQLFEQTSPTYFANILSETWIHTSFSSIPILLLSGFTLYQVSACSAFNDKLPRLWPVPSSFGELPHIKMPEIWIFVGLYDIICPVDWKVARLKHEGHIRINMRSIYFSSGRAQVPS